MEAKAEELGKHFGNSPVCPICGEPFDCSTGPHSPFTHLSLAIKDFKKAKGVEIEFVLPDESGK